MRDPSCELAYRLHLLGLLELGEGTIALRFGRLAVRGLALEGDPAVRLSLEGLAHGRQHEPNSQRDKRVDQGEIESDEGPVAEIAVHAPEGHVRRREVESAHREQGCRAEGRGAEPHPHAEQEDCHDGEAQEIDLADRAHGDQQADPESVVEQTDHCRSPPERDPVKHEETEDGRQRHRVDRHDGEGALFPQSVHARHVDQDTQERAHPQHELEQGGPQVVRIDDRLADEAHALHEPR